MKTISLRSIPLLLSLLPFAAAALLLVPNSPPSAEAPSSESVDAPEACRLDCTQGGQICVRRDFNLVRVDYYRDAVQATAVLAGNGYEWSFPGSEAYIAQGAQIMLTWEMKRDVRGTPCEEAIWAGADQGTTNPWYLQIRFIHPYQSFNGEAVVDRNSYTIRKIIPLGSLQPSSQGLKYRLQFGIVYQDYPTCITYQDDINQWIAFSAPSRRGDPPDDGGDPRRRGREPLRWSAPITAANLGQQPDPEIEGKSLAQIVNSMVEARPDNLVCSACHHSNAPFSYRPPVSQGQASPGEITPSTSISKDGSRTRAGTYRWDMAGSSGIIYAFTNASPSKPDYLKTLLAKWATDGYLH